MDLEREEEKKELKDELKDEIGEDAGGPARKAPEEHFPDHLEIVFGILFQPVPTLRRLVERPPLGLAFFVLAISTLISYVASLQGITEIPDIQLGQVMTGGKADPQMVAKWVMGIQAQLGMKLFPFQLLIAMIWWLISTSLTHMAAEFAGGHGRARSLLSLYGIVQMPLIFLAPATIIGRVAWGGLADLAGLALSIWVLVLSVLAVRENYSLGTGRAVGVYMLPVLGFFAALIVTVVAAVFAMALGSPVIS